MSRKSFAVGTGAMALSPLVDIVGRDQDFFPHLVSLLGNDRTYAPATRHLVSRRRIRLSWFWMSADAGMFAPTLTVLCFSAAILRKLAVGSFGLVGISQWCDDDGRDGCHG